MVGAWSYVWRYTIEANGTSGDPVAPPPTSRAANARPSVADERLTRDIGDEGISATRKDERRRDSRWRWPRRSSGASVRAASHRSVVEARRSRPASTEAGRCPEPDRPGRRPRP